MFRAVLDTSVILAALRSRRGASNRLIELVALERVRPLVTTALFLEYEEQGRIPIEAAGVGEGCRGAARKGRWRPLNQFIAVAVAEKVGVLETADEFLRRRAGKAKPRDLLKFTRKAGREAPNESDRR